jgi:hypothetical protein
VSGSTHVVKPPLGLRHYLWFWARTSLRSRATWPALRGAVSWVGANRSAARSATARRQDSCRSVRSKRVRARVVRRGRTHAAARRFAAEARRDQRRRRRTQVSDHGLGLPSKAAAKRHVCIVLGISLCSNAHRACSPHPLRPLSGARRGCGTHRRSARGARVSGTSGSRHGKPASQARPAVAPRVRGRITNLYRPSPCHSSSSSPSPNTKSGAPGMMISSTSGRPPRPITNVSKSLKRLALLGTFLPHTASKECANGETAGSTRSRSRRRPEARPNPRRSTPRRCRSSV